MHMTAGAAVAIAARSTGLAGMPSDPRAVLFEPGDGGFQGSGAGRAPTDVPERGLASFGQHQVVMKEVPPSTQIDR